MTAIRATLPYRSFRFFGDDTLTFLQGQLTQDLKLITTNHCHYGAFCNPKGRMLANFLIRVTPKSHTNDYILRLHEGQADTVIKRLTLFILRAAVRVEEQHFVHIGLNKQAAKLLCDNASLTLPEAFNTVSFSDDEVLCTLPGDYFELTLSTDNSKSALQEKLAFITEDIDTIETLRLRGGHFNILPETNELLLPQQTPLEAWGGINYKKGCYVGQEVISRNKYLGKVKKGLAYAGLEHSVSLALPYPIKQGEKTVGQIIETHNDKNQTACLALIAINAFSQATTIGKYTAENGFTPIIHTNDS